MSGFARDVLPRVDTSEVILELLIIGLDSRVEQCARILLERQHVGGDLVDDSAGDLALRAQPAG